jgi:hypothetical protein
MDRHMLAWSLLVGGVLGLAAPAAAQPTFEERNKDLGSASRGSVLEYKVKLTNNYDKELRVASVRTSCGCATASVSKNTLAPGESTFLTVRIDTNKYAGSRTFTIYTTFDRPRYEESSITVSAFSRDDLMLSPTVLDFGTVRAGSEPSVRTTLTYSGGNRNWKITDILNDNGYLQPTLEEISRRSGNISYRLTVKLRNDLPPGSWHADLWLDTTDTAASKIRVPLKVEVLPVLTASPERLDFGRIGKAGQLEKKVVLRGAEPFKVTKIEGLEPNIEVTGASDDPKEMQVLSIRYKAGDHPGEIEKRLKIFTDLKKDNVVEVTLRGRQTP